MTGYSQIPEVVILRLPVYLRVLSLLEEEGTDIVSSHELGERLQMTPAQIRKDLSYFGRFGKQGRGYNVGHLVSALRQILGLHQEWSVAILGMGRVGRAILDHGGLEPRGFPIVAAFDIDSEVIGTQVCGLTIQDVCHLGHTVREKNIAIGIIAVPPSRAQEAIDSLVQSGIKAILSYVPVAARVPHGVWLQEIDPVLALQSMTFHIKSQA